MMSGGDDNDKSTPCIRCECGSYEDEDDDDKKSYSIPVIGRTGVKRGAGAARIERDVLHKTLKIRIDDRNNPEFWAELDLPWEMFGLVLKDPLDNSDNK
jgi:hypothetical protein